MYNPLLVSRLFPISTEKIVSDMNRSAISTEINSQEKDSFSNIFNSAITALDQKQDASNHAIQGLITGEADDLHSVMIKTTEAQISLEMAVSLRNKALESFNEIKNMSL